MAIKTKLTPIRFPGGKSNALKFLSDKLPKTFGEYREPFFGGGSVGLYLMQTHQDADFWINDLFYPVYCFWKALYETPEVLVQKISGIKKTVTSGVTEGIPTKGIPSECAKAGKALHTWCRETINDKDGDVIETACQWYILNKLSYSGMAMIGSYAPLAWDQNFTDNCIANLPKTTALMRGVKSLRITNLDYSELLASGGNDPFIFLDPPYDIKDKLYGKDGNMHDGFDHICFSEKVKACSHRWMITYNDDPDIQKLFAEPEYIKTSWELQYTMKAAKRTIEGKLASAVKQLTEGTPVSASITTPDILRKSGKKGKELLITSKI